MFAMHLALYDKVEVVWSNVSGQSLSVTCDELIRINSEQNRPTPIDITDCSESKSYNITKPFAPFGYL